MIYTDLTKKALILSFEAHKNQTDQSGIPYVYHPYEVASHLDDEYTICTALLHDVVEDTDTTFEDLEKKFPKEIIDALRLLTHVKDPSYKDATEEYLAYVLKIKKNPIAKMVKLADLKHNSTLSRLNKVTKKDLKRIEKYKKAIDLLSQ